MSSMFKEQNLVLTFVIQVQIRESKIHWLFFKVKGKCKLNMKI